MKLKTGTRYSWEYILKNTNKKWVILYDVNYELGVYCPKDGKFIADYNDNEIEIKKQAYEFAIKHNLKNVMRITTVTDEMWNEVFDMR